MPADVETMFYVREKPWHGLGTRIEEAPTSADALAYAGLDWEVVQKDVYTGDGSLIAGYKANTRSTDSAIPGIVSDRYKVVQNEDAFQFHRSYVVFCQLYIIIVNAENKLFFWLQQPAYYSNPHIHRFGQGTYHEGGIHDANHYDSPCQPQDHIGATPALPN